MRPLIVNRYVFREIGASFLFCLAIFLFTGLIAGFLPLLQRGMEAGLGLTLILFQMLITALPSTLVTVLPLSMTIGILLGLGRLTADNEIAAVKSSGIPVTRLLPPVLALGLIGFGLSIFCTLELIPRGVGEGRRLMHQAVTTRADAGIEERTFFDKLDGLVLYVEHLDRNTGILTNIFIRESSDPEEPKTIIARKGRVLPDPKGKALILHLGDGAVVSENRSGDTLGALSFESQIFRYPLGDLAAETSNPSLEEQSIEEVRARIRDAREKAKRSTGLTKEFYERVERLGRMIIAQRFAYPMACVALALMAFPLGVTDMGKSRLNNVSVGLVAVFAYYAFSLAAERAARSGLAPPEAALSMPPIVFIPAALYYIGCVRRERLPGIVRVVQSLFRMLRRESR
jgi:lipopolysaccharide export system permease protein